MVFPTFGGLVHYIEAANDACIERWKES
jgi:hypothetical protein